MVKYLFFDWDGTMMGRSRKLNDENVEAIRQLREKGHKVLLCSGRSPAYLHKVTEGIMETDGIVGCAGGAVWLDGAYIYENGIPAELMGETVEEFQKHGICFNYETKERVYYSPEALSLMDTLFRKMMEEAGGKGPKSMRDKGDALNRPVSEYSPEVKVQKMTFVTSDPAEFAKLCPFLEKHYFLNFFGPTDRFVIGEIIPKTCTKQEGIEKVLEHEQITWADTIGFGDSRNDIQMLSAVEIPVVWEGAEEELKKMAKYYFEDPDQGGISKALHRIGLI